jgi:hypothetical protein
MKRLALAFALASSSLLGCHRDDAPAAAAKPAWQLLASELPEALLSVSGRASNDVLAVGADKGAGPLVLHFDGKKWAQLHTGTHGDLWWVQTFADGGALLGGANGTVLHFDGKKFERMKSPGLGRQTVFGVWGISPDDFYAVGNASGRNGFVWHYHAGKFEDETLPIDLPRLASGELPGFFKVWGTTTEVWIVGAAGAVLHRTGTSPLTVIRTTTKNNLFTVSGDGDRFVAVGGASNGQVFDWTSGALKDLSPPGAGLIQGVFVTAEHGDWISGERGLVYTRATPSDPFSNVEHGLQIPAASSLHSIFVDSSGGVWSAGGNVLTPALDNGMLLHYGDAVPQVVIDDDDSDASTLDAGVASCPTEIVSAGKNGSIARRWDEQALASIRRDLPRPTIHARNLFHLSAAMWDVWAAYDAKAKGVFVTEKHTADESEKSRNVAISYAAYDLLKHRYARAIGGPADVACFDAVMKDLGLDSKDTHDTGDDPIAFGNRVAKIIIEKTANDGSDEQNDYVDPKPFVSPNAALVYDNAGVTLKDVAVWQPINLSIAATQNGIILPSGEQTYIGSNWGGVTPFAMKRSSDAVPWHDPGPAPMPTDPKMKDWLVEVIRKTAMVDPSDPTTIDISPGAYGHNSLGTNDGKGWTKNPVTNEAYAPNVVKMADFARVMAEFWADGPKSETPPGHWNTIANSTADSPAFKRQLFGAGPELDPLAWDVHMYLALNGALHDAAITAWDIKRRDVTVRAISLIRWMGGKGQSSDPKGQAYDPEGLPLVPGLIELITKESSAPGQRHEHLKFFVGQVAVRNWLGEPGDRAHQVSGVGWVRAVDWITYQRRTFVTPAFPGFISGHSTFSRAGAEVLASITGSPYFPGGLGEFVARKGSLQFEEGPTEDVHLQWASYFDASDEAGQSRIYGSIHIAPDDFAGRRLGHQVGLEAVAHAKSYF